MGAFTGCVVHQGHPVFFKSNCMVEVMGDSPENYTVVQTCLSGVAEGSGASLCSVGGSMLYLSENGVVSCSGSSVKSISEALGQQLTDGIATTDGRLYYLSAKDATGVRALYVYDTETHAWTREGGENIVYLGHIEGDTYAYCSNHVIDILGKDITHHGKVIRDCFPSMLSGNKAWNRLHGTRAIKRNRRRDLFKRGGKQLC